MKTLYYQKQAEKVTDILDLIRYSENKINEYKKAEKRYRSLFLFQTQNQYHDKVRSMEAALKRVECYYFDQARKLTM